jgi:ATP-dependent Clp protease adapter protein ClpS
MKKRYEKEISQLPKNHPMYKKAQFELEKIQSKVIRYYVLLLNDDITMHATIKLLDLLLDLLP